MTYQRLYRTMLAILRNPSAAEDCVQEAFLKAFRAWSGWKQDAPAEAWLHRIAINVAISYRRRERLREAVELVRCAWPCESTRLWPPKVRTLVLGLDAAGGE